MKQIVPNYLTSLDPARLVVRPEQGCLFLPLRTRLSSFSDSQVAGLLDFRMPKILPGLLPIESIGGEGGFRSDLVVADPEDIPAACFGFGLLLLLVVAGFPAKVEVEVKVEVETGLVVEVEVGVFQVAGLVAASVGASLVGRDDTGFTLPAEPVGFLAGGLLIVSMRAGVED